MAPSMFPQAKFDPIPPDLDLHGLVDRTPNFEWVLRIPAAQIRKIGQQEFERLVHYHVIQGGKPLVIERWNDRLPKSLFSAQWLEGSYDKKRLLPGRLLSFGPALISRMQRRTSAISVVKPIFQ